MLRKSWQQLIVRWLLCALTVNLGGETILLASSMTTNSSAALANYQAVLAEIQGAQYAGSPVQPISSTVTAAKSGVLFPAGLPDVSNILNGIITPQNYVPLAVALYRVLTWGGSTGGADIPALRYPLDLLYLGAAGNLGVAGGPVAQSQFLPGAGVAAVTAQSVFGANYLQLLGFLAPTDANFIAQYPSANFISKYAVTDGAANLTLDHKTGILNKMIWLPASSDSNTMVADTTFCNNLGQLYAGAQNNLTANTSNLADQVWLGAVCTQDSQCCGNNFCNFGLGQAAAPNGAGLPAGYGLCDMQLSCLGQSCAAGTATVAGTPCCTNTTCSLPNGSDISAGTKCCLAGGSLGYCSSMADCCQGADCVNNLCVSQIGSSCTTDCGKGLGLVCVGGKCLLEYGKVCQQTTDCASGVCTLQSAGSGATTETYSTCGCASNDDCPNSKNICNATTGTCTCLAQGDNCVTGAPTGDTSCCNGNCYPNLSAPNAPPNIDGLCPICPSTCVQPTDCDQSNGCDQGLACTYTAQTVTTTGSGAQQVTTYSPTSGVCATCVGNNAACVAYQYAAPVTCKSTADCSTDDSCTNNVCTTSAGVTVTTTQSSDNCCLGYSCNSSNLCVPDSPSTSGGGSDTGAIVGGVIGGLVVIGAGVWWYVRRKRNGSVERTKVTKADEQVMEADSNLVALQEVSEEAKIVQALSDPAATGFFGTAAVTEVRMATESRSEGDDYHQSYEIKYVVNGEILTTPGGIALAETVLATPGGAKAAATWFQAQAKTGIIFTDGNGNAYVQPTDSAKPMVQFGSSAAVYPTLDETESFTAVQLKMQGGGSDQVALIQIAGADGSSAAYQVDATELASYQGTMMGNVRDGMGGADPNDITSLTQFCETYPEAAAKLALFVKYRYGNLAVPKAGDRDAYMTTIGNTMLGMLKAAGLISADATLNDSSPISNPFKRNTWVRPSGMNIAPIENIDSAVDTDLQSKVRVLLTNPDQLDFFKNLTGQDNLSLDGFDVENVPAAGTDEYTTWRAKLQALAQIAELSNEFNAELQQENVLEEATGGEPS